MRLRSWVVSGRKIGGLGLIEKLGMWLRIGDEIGKYGRARENCVKMCQLNNIKF
jgi:hypothetical protein